MKKMLLITLSLLVLLAAACALLLQEKNITVGRYFTGSGGHYLIADSPLHLSGATPSHTDNGDKLLVLHGPVAERYPTQTRAYFCLKLADGTQEDARQAQAQMDLLPQAELPGTEPEPTCQLPHSTLTVGRMTLSVSGEWAYEIDESMPSIRLWRDDPAHSITFAYPPSFGVCGTGLETKEITLPSGLKGSMGTYDGKPYWSYIALEQDHVITLSCDGAWWSRHRDAVTALVNALYLSTE